MYSKSFNCLRAFLITAKCGFFLSFKKEMMMNYIKKAVTNTQTVATVALLAMAQTVLADGFSEVSSMAVTIRTGIYTIVGIVATLCLLWQMAQGFGGRKTWGDILETCLWIVFAGAAIAVGTWLFTKGGSMKVG